MPTCKLKPAAWIYTFQGGHGEEYGPILGWDLPEQREHEAVLIEPLVRIATAEKRINELKSVIKELRSIIGMLEDQLHSTVEAIGSLEYRLNRCATSTPRTAPRIKLKALENNKFSP